MLLVGFAGARVVCGAERPVVADLVIEHGQLHDGTGEVREDAAVAVQGSRIVAVGKFAVAGNPRVIDATGLVIAPGFIDLHTHSDESILQETTRNNANYLLQGVTAIVTGNCGGGKTRVGEFLRQVDEQGAGTHVLHLIPHGSIRRLVLGEAQRAPSPEELQRLEALVDEGMQEGAFGMSTGLIYTPGSFAATEELVQLAKVVSRHNGLYVSHIRSESAGLLDALEELLRIGREANLPVHVSHWKASGEQAWPAAPEALRMLLQAREAGQAVTADQYPYVASSTSLAATLIPAHLRAAGRLQQALDDPEQAHQLREAIRRALDERRGGRTLFLASYPPERRWQGKDLATLAQQEQLDAVELVLQIEQKGGAKVVNFGMHEETVRLFMRQPFVATASDGSAMDPGEPTMPHPRSYGCFPRKLGRYAIEEGVLTLAQAVRSASGLPADILRLSDRGYLRPNYYADLVIFDPATFRDRATFAEPHQYAQGVRFLLVNGQLAVDEGRLTGKNAGCAVRRMQNTKCEMQNANCKMRNAKCEMQNEE